MMGSTTVIKDHGAEFDIPFGYERQKETGRNRSQADFEMSCAVFLG